MATFEDFLSEGKKIQIKRRYTENHPASTVGKTASVRNAILKAVKDGVITEEEFTKILSELSGDHKQWRTRNTKYFNVSEEGIKLSKWGLRILAELDETPKVAEVNEKIKVTKDEWPYIEFKDGGKKHKVEFDYEDIIDDHGNEGQDQYWIGKDEDGQEWQIDVYADYRGEVEEIHYDTLMVAENKSVNEKDDAGDHLDNLESIVGKARDFFAIGKELDKGGYKKKYFYSDTMAPSYTIEVDGFRFAIINKRYVDKGDREVGDIAIGLLENIKIETTNMENTFSIYESFESFTGANGFLNEKLGSQILASILMSNKEGKYGKQNLSALAGGFYQMTKVALDKIQDEDFILDNDPQKAFKNHGGSTNIIFFISDNEKENPYLPSNAGGYGSLATIPGGGTLLAAMSGDREFYTNDWSRYSKNRAWKKDGKKGSEDQVGVNKKYRGWGASGLNNGKRIAEVSDRVIIVNLDLIRQKYSTDQIRKSRELAKAGAIAFTNDKDFKKANNDRYHQILATKAAKMPLDKMVADAIDMLTDQIKAGLASGEKTRYDEIKIGQNEKGKEVKLRDASNHMSNILDDYSRYCDYVRQEEESEKRYGSSESWYKREIKNYALSLKEKIAKIEGFDYAW